MLLLPISLEGVIFSPYFTILGVEAGAGAGGEVHCQLTTLSCSGATSKPVILLPQAALVFFLQLQNDISQVPGHLENSQPLLLFPFQNVLSVSEIGREMKDEYELSDVKGNIFLFSLYKLHHPVLERPDLFEEFLSI